MGDPTGQAVSGWGTTARTSDISIPPLRPYSASSGWAPSITIIFILPVSKLDDQTKWQLEISEREKMPPANAYQQCLRESQRAMIVDAKSLAHVRVQGCVGPTRQAPISVQPHSLNTFTCGKNTKFEAEQALLHLWSIVNSHDDELARFQKLRRQARDHDLGPELGSGSRTRTRARIRDHDTEL